MLLDNSCQFGVGSAILTFKDARKAVFSLIQEKLKRSKALLPQGLFSLRDNLRQSPWVSIAWVKLAKIVSSPGVIEERPEPSALIPR
jgi:hypothetical protein